MDIGISLCTLVAMDKHVIIVGAGPAGLLAAIAAKEQGHRILVLEQLDKPGVKLLATGGGRCNVTNAVPSETFMHRFGRQGRFMQPALAAMDAQGLRDFLEGLGVPTHCPDGSCVFPISNSARDVQQALLGRCRQLGVELRTKACVTALAIQDGKVIGVELGNTLEKADAVVLATGGASYPNLGGTGGGYALARQAGHRIIDIVPALVGLMTADTWPQQLAGVSVDARIWIDLPGQPKAGLAGKVLFTHRGISGPAVLDVSGDVASLLHKRKEVPVGLNLTDKQPQQWLDELAQQQRLRGASPIRSVLEGYVPARLAGVLFGLASIDSTTPVAHMPSDARMRLAQILCHVPLTVRQTEGFATAMVTRGGVALKEVDPKTLQSRLTRGLYFAGELLDLDGPCGGYNLQWAFSSGHLAGLSAGGPDANLLIQEEA